MGATHRWTTGAPDLWTTVPPERFCADCGIVDPWAAAEQLGEVTRIRNSQGRTTGFSFSDKSVEARLLSAAICTETVLAPPCPELTNTEDLAA